jgi:biotin transport system substrate-specific component
VSNVVGVVGSPRRQVLADLLPEVRSRTVMLVVAGALLTAVASQVRVPLGFTPVPINLATFAAVFVGGALGARRGAASMGVFVVAGVVGFPFFAGGGSGWEHVAGATGGYLLCYPLMAAIVGAAAERGRDRHVVPFVVAVVAANVVLYAVGAVWLSRAVGVPVLGWESSGFSMGVRPFLAGDLVKMLAAGALFPAAWRLVGRD